jgi:hypothetical protein
MLLNPLFDLPSTAMGLILFAQRLFLFHPIASPEFLESVVIYKCTGVILQGRLHG